MFRFLEWYCTCFTMLRMGKLISKGLIPHEQN